jgi:serine/threonine-protein kinase HipA
MYLEPIAEIEVSIWGRSIGTLKYNQVYAAYRFTPNEEYGASGLSISPILMPETKESYIFPTAGDAYTRYNLATYLGLPGIFSDSLPDSFGVKLINSGLGRLGFDEDKVTSLSRLAFVKDKALGALTYKSDQYNFEDPEPTIVSIPELRDASNRVMAVKTFDKISHYERDLIKVGAYAGGARAKALIDWNKETDSIFTPDSGREGYSGWLIKLDGIGKSADGSINSLIASGDYGKIEYIYNEMARMAGITVPETNLYSENGYSHFMSKRFDRVAGKRLHMATLNGIAHLDYRYRLDHSYEQYFDTILALGMGAAELAEGYRRMLFNVYAKNRDDHTKNFSFLMDEDSKKWSLSPLYDVSHAHNPQGTWTKVHQLSVNGKREDIKISDFNAVAKRYNVSEYKEIIKQVGDAVNNWKSLGRQNQIEENKISAIESDIRKSWPK